MTWEDTLCRDAYTPSCRRWIASWQRLIVLPSQGHERFQFIFQMVGQAPNLCDLWTSPKDCLICLPRMQSECIETIWQRTSFWTRSTIWLRGVELPSGRTLGGVSTGSYPGKRSSWTPAYTMTLSTQPVFSSRPDASTRGYTPQRLGDHPMAADNVCSYSPSQRVGALDGGRGAHLPFQ